MGIPQPPPMIDALDAPFPGGDIRQWEAARFELRAHGLELLDRQAQQLCDRARRHIASFWNTGRSAHATPIAARRAARLFDGRTRRSSRAGVSGKKSAKNAAG
jgi:hypothetical protein